jgi:gas vesicle protein
MTIRTSLLGGAALGALIALAIAPAAEAKTKRHYRRPPAPAADGVRSEIDELKAEVQSLEAWKDQESAARAQTADQVSALQNQLSDANARAERAEEQVQAQIQTIPGAVDAEVAKTKARTDALYIKGIKFTLGGFTALETVSRDRNMTSDITTNFSAIPFTDVPQSHAAETRFTARQSRVSGLAQADISPDIHVEGYGEFDFLGAAQTANSNESNSYNPRIRNLYGDVNWDRPDGGTWHVLLGQSWSLATLDTTGIMPRAEAPPTSIDAQYVVGFVWARQPQIRVTYDWNKEFWASLSLENPQTTFAGASNVFLPGISVINTALPGDGSGGSLLYNTTSYSLNNVPDVIGKFAFDENPDGHKVHGELFAMARNFYERVNVGGTSTTTGTPVNRSTEGWGIGGSLEAQVVPQMLDAQLSVLWGQGVGRYATAGLPDIAFSPDGNMHPIPELAVLGGATWHATPQLDIYGYAGEEYEEETAFSMEAKPGGPFTNGGLGNERFTNDFACGVETTATAAAGSGSAITAIADCNGQTHYVYEGTLGFWHRPWSGAFGHFQWGLQYEFVERAGFVSTAPVGGLPVGAPHAKENILMSSFRFYPFQ